ncbi:MAG: helix-turn-helix domain-containing protein [Acidobacteriota bacterium]
MDLNAESLRYILGLKLRQMRHEQGLGLKELSKATGMSMSYLSEIEKGRKYPKPDKILHLSQALGVSFEHLVSPKVEENLVPVRELFSSPFLQEFPFHLFGLGPESLVSLVTEVPSKAGALLRTFFEIGRTYDVRVEHFLFAALRSYQQLHQNYFEHIESAAEAFLSGRGWLDRRTLDRDDLAAILEGEHGYEVDFEILAEYPELADLRSAWVDGEPPRVLVNPRLRRSQQAFLLGRELGYLELGLKERSTTSSPIRVQSFDQVIHDFEAAYFSGALLLRKGLLLADLERVFTLPRFEPSALTDLLDVYDVTPETFFYRLSQLLPHALGFRRMFFVRFSYEAQSERYRLSKLLNMTRLPVPLGVEPGEHYCRLWPGPRLLAEEPGAEAGDVRVSASRSTFLADGEEYLIFTFTRPLSLAKGVHSSVSLGFAVDDVRGKVAFLDDPTLTHRTVGITCERCPLQDCSARAAPPLIHDGDERQRRREAALTELERRVHSDRTEP